MHSNWITILPPIIVLAVAIFRRNVIMALLTGIVSAAFIASDFSIINSIKLIFNKIIEQLHIKNLYYGIAPDHLYTFGFLIILGILISLITLSGGIAAYSKKLETRLKTKKNVEFASIILSSLFFIDDYLNSLMVGCIARPITDKFKIPRAKLAFLLDAMSPTMCVLVPASSWIALILSQLENSGVNQYINQNSLIIADPFNVYVNSILYMFYPIILIISTLFIINNRISFGPMKKHELIAEKENNLFGLKEAIGIDTDCQPKVGSILDFVLPISIFLIGTVLILLYSGNWLIFGGDQSFIKAILSGNPFLSLFASSLISLIVTIIYLYSGNKLTNTELKIAIVSGFNLMKNSLIVLLLAWTLGAILKEDLKTGNYLAGLLSNSFPGFLIPLIIFLASLIVSSSTGSAWGTIAIIMPLAIPIVVKFSGHSAPIILSQAKLVYSILGALISGAIAGGHVSPISDATVMASTSAGSYHLDHLITQIAYVIPVIISCSISLIATGLLTNYNQLIALPVSLILGITSSLTMLYVINKIQKN